MRKDVRNTLDLRARFIFVIAMTACSFFTGNDAFLTASAFAATLYLSLSGFPLAAVQLAVCYPAAWALAWAAGQFSPMDGLVVVFSLMKKMIVPVMAAVPISKAPTGVLIATLKAARMPYSLTLSIAVMFRFMPTIHMEYRAIRNAQKFRGIGDSFWTLIRNPINNMEYILIPLLIRTARIPDELSASAMARGADDGSVGTTYTEVHFGRKDGLFIGFSVIFAILMLTLAQRDWQAIL